MACIICCEGHADGACLIAPAPLEASAYIVRCRCGFVASVSSHMAAMCLADSHERICELPVPGSDGQD